MVPLPHSLTSTPSCNRLHDFPVSIPRCRRFKNAYVNNFLSHTLDPGEGFLLMFDQMTVWAKWL